MTNNLPTIFHPFFAILISQVAMDDICGSIHNYISNLDHNTLNSLYRHPASVLAIFRLLSPFDKSAILQLLYSKTGIEAANLISPESELFLLNIAARCVNILRVPVLTLNSVFQESLHNVLTCGGDHASGKAVEIKVLDNYANEKWNAILHFLVGTPSEISKTVKKLLEQSGLMSEKSEAPTSFIDSKIRNLNELKITQKGFQFLLQDVKIQVWAFLLQYADIQKSVGGMEASDVLNFLFKLGSLDLGQDYNISALTEPEKAMIKDFGHLGLIYRTTKKSTRYYPTRLATSLMSSNQTISFTEEANEEYIILETNYRLYAYCQSPLKIAVLALFVDLRARFPNMVFGVISRDRVRQAMDMGITADQIISYLSSHAHPEMRKIEPVLPVTVVDQIKLWELERNRMKFTDAYKYADFPRLADYKTMVGIVSENDGLIFENERTKVIFVKAEKHEAIKAELDRLPK